MLISITSDSNKESGVGEVVDEISGPTKKYFLTKDYGVGLLGIGVVLMCRNPDLNFKRRVRFSKKEKILSMDIMLALDQAKQFVHKEKKNMIVDRILVEVPAVLQKYSISDFDKKSFLNDLEAYLK